MAISPVIIAVLGVLAAGLWVGSLLDRPASKAPTAVERTEAP